MSVVDHLLSSLIKHLQKTQKARKKRKKTKRKSAKAPRKSVKSKVGKKRLFVKKRKAVPRKKPATKKPIKKSPKKASVPVKAKKKPAVKKKKIARKPSVRPKAKSDIKKKVKKVSSKNKSFPKEICIGEITHFFSRIQVVVLKMTNGSLSVGDHIHIKGRGTDLVQKTGSLQIESVDVKIARKGQLVGLKVSKAVKVGSKVYKISASRNYFTDRNK